MVLKQYERKCRNLGKHVLVLHR